MQKKEDKCIDTAERWLQKHDPSYYTIKDRNKEEYKYLTYRQLRRVREEEITLPDIFFD